MKVLGYIRVSSVGQVRDGYGLEAQEHEIRTWCEREGHELVGIVAEPAKSGGEGLEGRVKLADALWRIEHGEAEALVVGDLSRLARDVVLQETVIATHPVISVREPDLCSNDPTRKLLRQIVGALNEWYRAMLKLQLAGGKAAKGRRGGFTGGQPRFGTRAEERELVPYDDELETLGVMMFMRGEGKSLEAIAAELNKMCIPTRKGGRWHPWTVSRILSRAA